MAILDTIPLFRPVARWSVYLLAGIVIYFSATVIYRLFFSPLSKIPGPWITRVSSVLEANALKNNRRTAWVNELFSQYPGTVAVRTGPNSVSFNHPDAVKAIYGHGKGAEEFSKSSWYDSFSTTGESLFSTRSKKRHAMKRRMVAHGFSMQSLYLFEPYVDLTIGKFLRRMDDFAATGHPFDIYFWFELFTMDLMGELAFGRSFGALDDGKPARYSTLVELSQRFGNLSGILPFGKHSVNLLSWVPLPYVQNLWRARVEYLEYARTALEKRFQDDRHRPVETELLPTTSRGKPRQDIMQRFIEAQDPETGHRMDFAELRAEASSLMVAGASTGSVTLNWLTYYLCKNPSVRDRIINELETVFPDASSNSVTNSPTLPTFSKLNKMSLLEASEIECLRMHPPIGYATPRTTPAGGAVICGVYVPGNVDVGVPAAIIGRNPTVYQDPDVWDPERWLVPPQHEEKGNNVASGNSADLSTMKTSFLGFGFGSRQCIGRNVANLFIMKMMAALLLRYDIQLEDPGLVLGTKEFTILKPDRRFNVILRPRGPRPTRSEA